MALLFPRVPAVPGSQRGDAMLRYLSLDAEASDGIFCLDGADVFR